jgi:membrane-associated phospholipid phosphatase
MSTLWSHANFTDRMYLAYFIGIAILILLFHQHLRGWPALLALHLVCIAVVLLLVVNARRFRIVHDWYPVALPILTFQLVARLNFLLVDAWRDHYLLAFEAWLFPQPPTVWLGRFTSPLVTEILQIGYLSYYFLMVIVAAVLYRRADKAPFSGAVAAGVLSYMLCYVVFITFPTEGPAHTLRHLHTVPLTGGLFRWLVNFMQRGGVHGNAFPSAHVAGSVAPLLFAWRYVPRLAAWLTPFVILLCIGAVYDRYHYASDIFAGILVGAAAAYFVMFVQARPKWARPGN